MDHALGHVELVTNCATAHYPERETEKVFLEVLLKQAATKNSYLNWRALHHKHLRDPLEDPSCGVYSEHRVVVSRRVARVILAEATAWNTSIHTVVATLIADAFPYARI